MAYPNPAMPEEVTIVYASSTASADLLLVSANGNIIKTIFLPPGSMETTISLSGIPKGVYQLVWTDGTHKKTTTLLVI